MRSKAHPGKILHLAKLPRFVVAGRQRVRGRSAFDDAVVVGVVVVVAFEQGTHTAMCQQPVTDPGHQRGRPSRHRDRRARARLLPRRGGRCPPRWIRAGVRRSAGRPRLRSDRHRRWARCRNRLRGRTASRAGGRRRRSRRRTRRRSRRRSRRRHRRAVADEPVADPRQLTAVVERRNHVRDVGAVHVVPVAALHHDRVDLYAAVVRDVQGGATAAHRSAHVGVTTVVRAVHEQHCVARKADITARGGVARVKLRAWVRGQVGYGRSRDRGDHEGHRQRGEDLSRDTNAPRLQKTSSRSHQSPLPRLLAQSRCRGFESTMNAGRRDPPGNTEGF
jgi:hypothetical protein